MRQVGMVVLCSLLLGGCGTFEQLGRSFGEGLRQRADTIAVTAGGGIVRGARTTLGTPATTDTLHALIERLGVALNSQVTATRDSIVGVRTQAYLAALRDDLLGDVTGERVRLLRSNLVGEEARLELQLLREEVLGQATRQSILMLRDDLLGPVTSLAVQAMVDEVVARLAESYQSTLRPLVREDIADVRAGVREDVGFIQRNATTIIWTLGVVIACIVILVAYFKMRARRQRKMLELLTVQIDKMPDQQAYDELTHRIQHQAQKAGLEPDLRKVLVEQGL